ncbi:MAG: hypothetical protein IT384_21475 [Deltaproteobacteria bacterium]|nr:hypothetical protein [Deltaproteobacteria bacterium]
MLSLVLILSLAEPSPAALRTPLQRVPERTRSSTSVLGPTALGRALARIPDFVPAAVVIPNPERLLTRAAVELARLGAVLPAFRPSRIRGDALARFGVDLSDPKALATIGIDAHSALIVMLDPAGGPLLAQLALRDPGRFEAFLAQASHARTRAGDSVAYVLVPRSGRDEGAMGCTVRGMVASCQLGLSARGEPLAELQRLIDAPSRRYAHSAGLAQATARLPADADAYVLARADALAPLASQAVVAHALREARFAPPDQRRRSERVARARAVFLHQYLHSVEGAALALDLDKREVRIRAELVLDERGAALMRDLVRRPLERDPLARWAESPALARLIVHLRPEIAADLLARAGLALPAPRLSGSLAVLALGLDTECGAAKAGAPPDPETLPFIFPTALAVGLASRLDRGAGWLNEALGIPASASRDGVLQAGHAYGSPFELRAADEALLIGTGLGAGSAASRRWERMAPPAQRAPAPRPVLEAVVSLPAVAAALGGGAFNEETRAELRELADLHRRWQPVLERFAELTVHTDSSDAGRGLRVDVQLTRR